MWKHLTPSTGVALEGEEKEIRLGLKLHPSKKKLGEAGCGGDAFNPRTSEAETGRSPVRSAWSTE